MAKKEQRPQKNQGEKKGAPTPTVRPIRPAQQQSGGSSSGSGSSGASGKKKK